MSGGAPRWASCAAIRIGDVFRIPPVTIAGPQPEPYEVEAAGSFRGFYVRFTAVGPLARKGEGDAP